jgi:hypothetical protein
MDLVTDFKEPIEILKKLADEWNIDFYSKTFALKLDQSNLWPTYKDRFYYPKLKYQPKGIKNLKNVFENNDSLLNLVDLNVVETTVDEECIYLSANSLGLQTKTTRECINENLDKWALLYLSLGFS